METQNGTECTVHPIQVLRGLGRYAYRCGLTPFGAVQRAASVLERSLDASERRHVMAGWSDERAEMVAL